MEWIIIIFIIWIIYINVTYKPPEDTRCQDELFEYSKQNNPTQNSSVNKKKPEEDSIKEPIDLEHLAIYNKYKLDLKRSNYSRQDYEDYINHSHIWKDKKRQRYRIDNGICQSCGLPVSYELSHCHHKDYKTLYDEDLNSIETLHSHCHAEKHKKE